MDFLGFQSLLVVLSPGLLRACLVYVFENCS